MPSTSKPPDEVLKLIERFDNNVDSYRSGRYNETQVRIEFIDPLFKALGWDVQNEKGYAEAYKDVIHEEAIKIGAATKAPDYCFRIGGTRKFFLEAKKPSVNLKEDVSPAFQLRRYAWSAKLPLSILTDFEELAVYDCRLKPVKNDTASTARVKYLTYQEYGEKWEEINSIFSRDAVLKGSFDKFAETSKLKKGTAAVDDVFLKEIEQWRSELARTIALRNPKLSQRELNFSVQRTIDRIIFLRICEDRGIELYGRLMALGNGENVYRRLCDLFHRADERYNSGLFHFNKERDREEPPDELTLQLAIDDKPLKEILKSLYYPESPYEFSVLPADILGQVYEQFLGKVIRLTAAHRAVIEDKPEVKKAGGVYYTPTYIVDYIVKNTVGRLLDEDNFSSPSQGEVSRRDGGVEETANPLRFKRQIASPLAKGTNERRKLSPKHASPLRILDPACGSGSFLIGAYQYLLDWHRDWYVNDGAEKHATGKKPALYQASGGDWRLTTAERKRILLNNIYGVDIDPQAVEVTKLSLLLKVLEGENDQTLTNQLKLIHERALPDLSSNIKCGNSLIGPDFYDGQQLSLMDDEERMRINAFDWKKEFPEIFRKESLPLRASQRPVSSTGLGGDKEGVSKGEVSKKKKTPPQSSPERGGGYDGGFDAVIGNPPYIFARDEGFTEDEKGYFKKFSYQNYQLNTYALFTEQCFSLLRSNGHFGFIIPNNWLSISTMKPFRDFLVGSTGDLSIVNHLYKVFHGANVDTSIITFKKGKPTKVRLIESAEPQRFTEVASMDPASLLLEPIVKWRLYKNERAKSVILKCESKAVELERVALVKAGLKAYETGKGQPVQTDKMKEDRVYHSTRKRDKTYRIYLGGKDVKRYSLDWSGNYLKYGPNLAAPREPALFQGERILVRQIPSRPPYSINGMIVSGEELNDINSMIIKPTKAYSIKYLLGVINSKLLSFWFDLTFDKFQRAIFPQFKVDELSKFPIRAIDFNNPADKSRHDKMVALVGQMLELHKQLAAAKTEHEKTALHRQIDTTDNQIDQLVYELYGLTEEEVKIVEGS